MQKNAHRLLLVTLCALGAASPVVAGDSIRGYLEGLDAGDSPTIAGRRLNEPDLLSQVYRSHENRPIWTHSGPLQKEATNLLAAIGESVAHGFAPERYHRSAIERLMKASDDRARLALEILLTDAFLSQALHRGSGALHPPNLDAEWQVPKAEVDGVAFLLEVVRKRRNVRKELVDLWPVDVEYAVLVSRRSEIVASGDEYTVQIAPGGLLKPGQTDDRIVLLKERLMGPGDYSTLYDEDLRREVMAFQRQAGLEPDGIVGDNTLDVLNATRVSWVEKIDANLERWRWLPRQTPETYIRVNIAAFTLRAIEKTGTTLKMNVIVGKPYRRTPVFYESIKYLVVNPFWNVPFKIATEDKLPKLKSNASAEAERGFEAKPAGSDTFVPVDVIDWSNVTKRTFNYLLRQKPGEHNSLGRMKFMMPNPYAVYLHDTPGRELFARQERTFSSGCVRLERPRDLAAWLLSRERSPELGRLDDLLSSGETATIYLKDPVPTYIVYLTAFVADDGDVAFRRDIYGRDRVLIDALREQGQ